MTIQHLEAVATMDQRVTTLGHKWDGEEVQKGSVGGTDRVHLEYMYGYSISAMKNGRKEPRDGREMCC